MPTTLDNHPVVGVSLYPDWPLGVASFSHIEALFRRGMRVIQLPAPAASKTATLTVRVDRLVQLAARRGIECVFHLPVTEPYNPGSGRDCRATLSSVFTTLDGLLKRRGVERSTIVFHGAQGAYGRLRLLRVTDRLLQWCGDFLPSLSCQHRLLLENVTPRTGIYRVGQDWDDFSQLQSVLARKSLGICRDLGHELEAARRGCQPTRPSKIAVSRIFLMHVHDTNAAGRGHYPIQRASLEVIRSLGRASADIPIVIESLRDRAEEQSSILNNFASQLKIVLAAISQKWTPGP